MSAPPPPISQHTLRQLRQASYDESLDTIKTRSSLDENKIVFENLVMLRNAFTNNSTNKRDFDSTQSESILLIEATDFDANLPPRKKGRLSNKLLVEDPNYPSASDHDKASRPPLLPSDIATMTNEQDIKSNVSRSKRDISSQLTDNTDTVKAAEENLPPKKLCTIRKNLFSDESSTSQASHSHRPPLFPIDTNSINIETRWAKGSSNQIKKHERMLKAKASKSLKKNAKP